MNFVQTSKFAFIFDLDGTLLDSFHDVIESLNETASEFDLPDFDSQITWENFGKPLNSILYENKIPKAMWDLLTTKFRLRMHDKALRGSLLFDGAYSLITRIHKCGFRLGIATSKPSNLAKTNISNSKLRDFPFEIIGGEKFPNKPDPTSILQLMKTLNVDKGIMIGDRVEDIQAGMAAKIHTCAVLQSAHRLKDFKPLRPDMIVNSIKDLDKNFDSLLRFTRS